MCDQCVRKNSETKRFSDDNGMISLTLVYELVAKLRYCVDAMLLECMPVSLAHSFMRVVCHKSGSLVYQSYTINFIHDFNRFLGISSIPRQAINNPYFVTIVWQWEDFNPHALPHNAFLGVYDSQIPRDDLRSSNNIFRVKCSGMKLVSLSRVCKLNHFLLPPLFIGQSKKIIMSNRLPIIWYAYG